MGRSRANVDVVFLVLMAVLPCASQTMNSAEQAKLVDTVIAEVKDKYPFPKLATEIESRMKQNVTSGVYSKISNPEEFAGRLTFDLQSISKDRHFKVSYTPEPQKVQPLHIETMYAPAEDVKRMEQNMRATNYDASEVKILPGNIGYVKLQSLTPLEFSGDLYAAIMRFVANSDALIFDLRECTGATSVDSIPMLAGYLFEHPVHLTNIYMGGSAKERQLWSFGYVPGPKYLHKPVYMVTSRSTFSGCEAFAYEMQALKRAVVIGEVTGGGGNPNAEYPIAEHYMLSVAFAHVENPVTHSNWNEKGVQPDVTALRAEALYRAHVAALEKLQASGSAEKKGQYAAALEDLQANPPEFSKVTFKLAGHAQAKEVSVLAGFNLFMPWANPLQKSNGVWTATFPVAPGRYPYLFLVDGQQVLDPANPQLNKDKRANILVVK